MAKFNNLSINKKNIIWIGFMLSFFIFLIILNKTLDYKKPEDRTVGIEYAKAEVIRIVSEELKPDPDFPYNKVIIFLRLYNDMCNILIYSVDYKRY